MSPEQQRLLCSKHKKSVFTFYEATGTPLHTNNVDRSESIGDAQQTERLCCRFGDWAVGSITQKLRHADGGTQRPAVGEALNAREVHAARSQSGAGVVSGKLGPAGLPGRYAKPLLHVVLIGQGRLDTPN